MLDVMKIKTMIPVRDIGIGTDAVVLHLWIWEIQIYAEKRPNEICQWE